MEQQPTTSINFLEEMSDFIFVSKYARYNDKEGRRETLNETVDRVCNMHLQKYFFLSEEDKNKIIQAFEMVKQKKVVPSMRSMQFGGKAIEAHHARIYNCGVRHIDSIRAFSEFFYCLLAGTGMTAGVTEKVISNLPNLVSKSDKTGTVLTYVIEDSIEGWADSVSVLLECYHKNTSLTGRKIIFYYSKIRPKGSPLKTGGGKAPGHEGLQQAHKKIKELLDHLIEDLYLDQLRSIDIYDILMHCADAVLSGGIRRAATMVIFDHNDSLMMNAKTNFKVSSFKRFEKINDKWEGTIHIKKKKYEVNISDWEYKLLQDKKEISWFHIEPQRARSNNSVLLLRTETTKKQFEEIIENTKQYGEPGFIFADSELALFNPCAEISFIPKTKDGRFGVQFCNLTEVNGGKIESLEDWKLATEAATILGTLQAGYTYFPYLSKAAKELTEEEALLGVSVTGWFDKPEILLNDKNQYMMAKLAIKVNEEWSEKIGINKAARVTCVKPSGTASTFFGTSSGIHPHHSRQYFRRVQMNKQDNVYKFFKQINPHATEESIWSNTKSDDVITFPITVNDKAILKEDLSAIEHLSYIKRTQENWVVAGTSPVNEKIITHNISSTVLVKETEWKEVIEYLFENKNYFAAVSLLPSNGDVIYAQAPFQKIQESDLEKWNDLVNNWKHIDWTLFNEESDNTKLAETLACAGGSCEIT